MYLGLDLGTSSLKAVLVDSGERIVGSASVPLVVERPRPGWSEQDRRAWWEAAMGAVDALGVAHPAALAAVRGIGLSGQMHGAVLLDGADRVLRPCILWNDARAAEECRVLEERLPDLHAVAGNLAMPGFTAPKLLWVARHEPDVFARTARVLLPKACLRLAMTGEGGRGDVRRLRDAVARRRAARLVRGRARGDRLVHGRDAPPGRGERAGGPAPRRTGSAPNSRRVGKCRRRRFSPAGRGQRRRGGRARAVRPGDAFVSLGTSGILWATTAGFQPYTEGAVHAFCHALPGLWHQMGVTLSAASSLAWWAGVAGRDEAQLLAEVGMPSRPSGALFIPYLAGERTPHNDATLRGMFAGLPGGTDRAAMTQAGLYGVAFSLRDCLDALAKSGTDVREADVIGGGSRSEAWVAILASVLGVPLHRIADGDRSGAFGAARLARLAVTGERPDAVCRLSERLSTIEPDPHLHGAYEERLPDYRSALAAARMPPFLAPVLLSTRAPMQDPAARPLITPASWIRPISRPRGPGTSTAQEANATSTGRKRPAPGRPPSAAAVGNRKAPGMHPSRMSISAGRLPPGAIGHNRGVIRPNYAFIPPDGVLTSRLPGYADTDVRFLAAPVLGARFAQFILDVRPGGGTPEPVVEGGVQHFLYVLSGAADLAVGSGAAEPLTTGGFAYVPPGTAFRLAAGLEGARILGLRKRYEPAGLPCPDPIVSHRSAVPRTNHTGLQGRGFQFLLPYGDMRFDFEMNLMWFEPGAYFPAVETHVMEHGLYMLQGQGLYLLGEDWHEIWEDDFIWMGGFCPQQFYPTGFGAAAYLLYKNVNRDVAV